MYQALKNMTTAQQVGVLFLVVFGLLLLAQGALFLYSMREFDDDDATQRHHDNHDTLARLLRTSWLLIGLFWLAWMAGETARLVLFAMGSFFALREFLTLSPTRQGDHRSLVMAFFVVLPVQYLLVAYGHYNLFTVFIPVYVFVAIPVTSALAGDPLRFLERNAKLQWGIMVSIYGLSHVPALLMLNFPGYSHRNAFLVFYLVAVVQISMVVQHLVARALIGRGHPPSVPRISSSFTWRAWGWGMLCGGLAGALLAGVTPFVPGQGFALGLVACASGSLGHLVMKALKRDRGIPIWDGRRKGATGAAGMLDRIDALCFAAPVFFHSVRWHFGI
jgi:phosphatidate cytidylyltransferase